MTDNTLRTPIEETVHQQQLEQSSRRSFVKGTATAAAALMLAPGVLLHQTTEAKTRSIDTPVSNENRWGMLIDTAKCGNGCDACVTACNKEHNLVSHNRPTTDAQWIRKVNVKNKTTKHEFTLPIMCQHCETAPCVDVCPTGASMKRKDGIVLVNKHICIGCRYCMMACPYKARSFVHEVTDDQMPWAPRGKGVVESCTLCVHRVDKEGDNAVPACAEACNKDGHQAMLFGDMNNEDSDLSKALKQFGGQQIRADLGLNTGIRYLGIS